MEAAKILIADDDESLRTLLKAILGTQEGYLIEEAIDGTDALNKISLNKPDIAILDVMMPGQGGFELCEKLKADPETQSIKILTLANKAEDSDWAKSVGADAFVSKPFDPIELLATLKALKA